MDAVMFGNVYAWRLYIRNGMKNKIVLTT